MAAPKLGFWCLILHAKIFERFQSHFIFPRRKNILAYDPRQVPGCASTACCTLVTSLEFRYHGTCAEVSFGNGIMFLVAETNYSIVLFFESFVYAQLQSLTMKGTKGSLLTY